MKRREFLGVAAASLIGSAASSTDAAIGGDPDVSRTGESASASRETYRASSRVRSGLALGGIGAGTFELRKNGKFYNWNIFNNFPKETGPVFRLPEGEIEDPQAANLFFLVRYKMEGQEARIKLLQISDGLYEGAEMGIAFTFPWMQAVDSIGYTARFPFSTLIFTDAEMPFEIRMEAWTPFIPHDIKNSSLPIAFFDFTVTAKQGPPVEVMLVMTGANNVGFDTPDRYYTTEVRQDRLGKTITMSTGGMDERASTWGQIALNSHSPDSTHYAGWAHRHPYLEYVLRHGTLPNLDDTRGIDGLSGAPPEWLPLTHGRNKLDPQTGKLRIHDDRLLSSIARSFNLRPGEVGRHTFSYSWNFPNLYAEQSFRAISDVVEGHYYSNFFATAADAGRYAMENRDALYRKSRDFLDDFFNSSAERFVLEQVNSQLNTFVTNGRLVRSGEFGVLEGLSSTWSWGPIGTIDVMLYGTVPIIALFPELQKSTMRCHRRSQTAQGEIAHGLQKGFHAPEDGTAGVSHRLDLAGQYVILVARDFFWSDDTAYLREMYPSIQRAVDYIALHRSFPGTSIPLMQGTESSYDNFPMYGYASYILSIWLCAIACACSLAEVLGDPASVARYKGMLDETRSAVELQLWNGKYFSLYNDVSRAAGHGGRSEGCLTDQLVGQWAAHQIALGHLLDSRQIVSSLDAILQQSYKPGFGLRNCSWPGRSDFAEIDRDMWVDQGNTCWSGVELAFASFLLYEGRYPDAMAVVRTVDERYRKNGLYFDHQEFGGHYFRPMSAWGILNGLLGFAVNRQELFFDPAISGDAFQLFFATATGTAHYIRSGHSVRLHCLSGTLSCSAATIAGVLQGDLWHETSKLPATRQTTEYLGRPATRWTLPMPLLVKQGESLRFV